MTIDVYSDVACPWCYIGKRRLDAALAQFGGEVDVNFRPYQLDPGAPETATPLRAHLERRFGPRVDAMLQHVSSVASGEGITMDWAQAVSVNTRTAHRLLRLARLEYGPAVERQLAEQLFALHFSRGGNVADHAELTAEAVAAGMDEQRVTAYLASAEGTEELAEAFEDARRRGIAAVPTFVFNGRHVVQGAQPAEVLADVLARVSAEEQASAEPTS